MLPAYQRLGARYRELTTFRYPHLRLVVQTELVACNRPAQLSLSLKAFGDTAFQHRVKEVNTPTARSFGFIHSHLGLLEQHVGVFR